MGHNTAPATLWAHGKWDEYLVGVGVGVGVEEGADEVFTRNSKIR